MKALHSLPKSLTKCQRESFLKQACANGISDSELDNICSLLSTICIPSINDLSTTTLQHVMAPPTGICLECGENLVAYHTCDVKNYNCKEVYYAKKFTLRCAKCCVLYNYSQYGDKHQTGFRYYQQERPAVEVTDTTVYFDRQLLDWQCSLA